MLSAASSPRLDKRISSWLAGKPSGPISLQNAWQNVLTRFASLPIDPATADALQQACSTPAQLQQLIVLLHNEPPGPDGNPTFAAAIQSLLESVDESSHSLSEWITALCNIADWLRRNHRRRALSELLGYIDCTAASLRDSPQPGSLATAVQIMLETYGME